MRKFLKVPSATFVKSTENKYLKVIIPEYEKVNNALLVEDANTIKSGTELEVK